MFNGTSAALQDNISSNLSNLFIGCYIPINKLENSLLSNFLKTYCKDQIIPSSSTLRKNMQIEVMMTRSSFGERPFLQNLQTP